MRHRALSVAAAAGGAALAGILLCGCNGGATTDNGVTPGPPLPAGMTLPPGAVYQQLATVPPTPSP
ncbi:MAG: hypothetical protein ACJ74O_07100 [Frankiaceae bacterium]